MKNEFGNLIFAAIETVRAPRAAAQTVMAQDMERQDRWRVLLLISIVSAILAYISLMVSALVNGVDLAVLGDTSPLMLALSQVLVLSMSVIAIHVVGRRFGGTGNLDDAILLVAWIQVVLACLQIVQIAALMLMPTLAVILGLVGMVLLFVLLTIFVAELHGFRSVGGVFAMVLFVMLMLATTLNFVFSLFGYDMLGIV